MPYREININPNAPPHVKKLVRRLEDHYLRDVHCMLRLPIPNYRLTAGCNFAITQVLMATISGISVTLFSHTGSLGKRFKNLLVGYYPWDLEPQTLQTAKATLAADIIYSVFRNPITHDLGLDLKKKSRTPKVKIKRLSGLSETKIEEIENTKKRYSMSATITVWPDATVLLVEALYWGVRVMLERLVNDQSRMQIADAFLASILI